MPCRADSSPDRSRIYPTSITLDDEVGYTRLRVGEGWGGGVVQLGAAVPHGTTPTPDPLPTGASLGTHLMMRFGLALGESRVILSLPSRFGRLSDGRDGYWIFWRRASKKNGAQLLGRVCERQTVCLRRLGDNRAEKVRFRRFLMNDRVTVEKMLARLQARVAEAAAGLDVLAIQDTRQIHYGS